MTKPDLTEQLQLKSQLIDKALSNYLPKDNRYPATLYAAMEYSLAAGGKRLRPIMVMAAAEAVGGDPQSVIPVACAIEMIHTYSLIHDDLPAMDNDDYRRGKLTSHKVYGEAMAILTGDALLTLAFRLITLNSKQAGITAESALQVVDEIALAAGATGMIGGQVVDLESENKVIDADTLKYIHSHKTGALYCASLRSGAILGGAAANQLEALTRYGEFLGLAFQITDDILDLEGDSKKLGKKIGSDLKKKKATYPSLFGMESSKQMASEAVTKAIAELDIFNGEADLLRAIAGYMLERDH